MNQIMFQTEIRPETILNIKANDCILIFSQTSHTHTYAGKTKLWTENLYFTARRTIKWSMIEICFHLPEKNIIHEKQSIT